MSLAYNQVSFGQPAGFYGGQSDCLSAGFVGGQSFGQTGGYYGGQNFGQAGGQYGNQGFVQVGGYGVGSQGFGQAADYFAPTSVGQNVTASTPAYLSSESPYSQQGAAGQVEVKQRAQSAASLSSGSLSSEKKATVVTGTQGAANSSQQNLAGSSYGAGTAVGGSFDTTGASVGGQRRQARVQRQVIRLPDQPQGPARQVRRRLPTPEPDTIERVYHQRTAAEVVEEIIEVPTTPPPIIKERNVVEPAGPAQVVKRVIRVPPRSAGQATYQQQGGSAANFQTSSSSIQQGGVTSVSGFGAPVSGGYTGAAVDFSGFGASGAGYQQQFFGAGVYSQPAAPSFGTTPAANCFYV